jgi:ribonuclease-3
MIERIISVDFKDKNLIKQALTHPSLSKKSANYERLEFLGDHVLGLVISEALFTKFPKEDEGQLTKRLAGLICGESLAIIARKLNLGEHIQMATSEETGGGRANKANLENAMEAIIGAIYLDQGLEVARGFVINNWSEMMDTMVEPPKDAKSSLQEWAQGRGLPLPEYVVVATEGPSHAPIFEVKVTVQGLEPAQGNGTSKRAAEQEAAARLLAFISNVVE